MRYITGNQWYRFIQLMSQLRELEKVIEQLYKLHDEIYAQGTYPKEEDWDSDKVTIED